MFKHKLIIRGNNEDLNRILESFNIPPDVGRVIRHSDPLDVKMTPQQTQEMLRGKPIFFGTTRVEIEINFDKDGLKKDILSRFPNVTIS